VAAPLTRPIPGELNFLKRDRATLAKYLPSLDAKLAEIPLLEIEQPGNPGLSMLRDLEGTSLLIPAERGEAILVEALLVRFAVQQAIERASARAAELLGGMSFIGSPDVAYLLAAGRALAFHPPSRLSVAPALDGYLMGKPMQVA